MNFKKLTALVLSSLMLVACSGSSSASTSTATPSSTSAASDIQDGTYTATSEGHNGSVEVSVTFESGKITDVTIGENSETDGLATPALAAMNVLNPN